MKAEDRATISIAEKNYRMRGSAKLALIEDLRKLDKMRMVIGNAICQLYPAGVSVHVKLRSGQKKLTPAVVSDAVSWQDGHIRVKLLNAKPHSRQKLRDIHIGNVYFMYEEPR